MSNVLSRIGRGWTALLIAVVALTVVAGGATAASRYVITKPSQIKPAVRKALAGKTGRTGATGPAGPIGPSNAFVVESDAIVAGPINGSQRILAIQDLPAGDYLITAKVDVTRSAPNGIHVASCVLNAGGETDVANGLAPDATGVGVTLATEVARTFTAAGSASVSCSMTGASWNGSHARMTALKVGAVTPAPSAPGP
ncbi:hypothetical protein [Patulibacter defluvii]|uniref:hypothetical protein n=1 Tax=Patulibacter defluvii TaxID=3095358 RepID=UPI002A7624C7|nr:hypothetical protein [Patulibacter sp. DM4]